MPPEHYTSSHQVSVEIQKKTKQKNKQDNNIQYNPKDTDINNYK